MWRGATSDITAIVTFLPGLFGALNTSLTDEAESGSRPRLPQDASRPPSQTLNLAGSALRFQPSKAPDTNGLAQSQETSQGTTPMSSWRAGRLSVVEASDFDDAGTDEEDDEDGC